jgi:hypothetical protein
MRLAERSSRFQFCRPARGGFNIFAKLRTVPAFAGLSSCHRHDEFADANRLLTPKGEKGERGVFVSLVVCPLRTAAIPT